MKDQRSRGRRSSKAAALAALLQEDYTMKTEKLGTSLPLQVPQMDQRVISLTWILISVALLVSCTTSFTTFDQALPLLKGRNINQSIDYLGIPDKK